MTKEDLDAFIEREADKYAISEFCEKESPVQHENSKIDFKEGSNLLAPLLLQAMERIEMVASMDRFDSFEVSAEIINCRLLLTLFKETLERPIEIEAALKGEVK